MRLPAVVPAFLLFAAVASSVIGAQDAAKSAAAPFAVPPELAGKTNPIKSTPEGLAHAKKMYGYDCAICHGATGDGKGDIASSMKAPLKDLSDPTVQARSDGELFHLIQKGYGEMPGEGDRSKEADIWNMVSYVRSFAKK